MSGIEVVGLVLGVLPLLITGLEHYAEGVRTIGKIKNASQHFATYKRALGTERAIFENNLRYLLEIELETSLVDRLFEDVNDPCWAGPDVERCLRRRLGRSYDAFFDTARAVNVATDGMIKSLQLTKDGKGPFDSSDKKSVKRAINKLVFGMRIKKYDELLDVIVLENQRLNLLSQQTRDLDSIRESRVATPDFEIGRNHAHSLFNALQAHSVNSCKLRHSISLFMNPAEAPGTRTLRKVDPKRLRAVFTHQWASISSLSPSWTIEETEIEPVLDDSDSESDDSMKPSTVRFAVSQMALEARRNRTKLCEIYDLCASFQSTQSSPAGGNAGIGYLPDHHINRRHGLFRSSNPIVNTTSSTISLAHIIGHQDDHRLRPKDKQVLALSLALGMLRLHNTPWLRPQWGRHEVSVFHHTGDLVVSHPVISVDICSAPEKRSSPPRKYFRTCRLIVEPTLFALGILLIELALEMPFESLITPDEYNPDGTKHKLTDFYAASRLVDDVYEAAGFRYGGVVKRCVNCEFDHPPQRSSLLDAEFRKKVYHGIVESLQQDVDDVRNI